MNSNKLQISQFILLSAIAFLSAAILFYTISIPAKYSMTLTLGVLLFPLVFVIRNKEKLLIGAFIFSLPIGIGLKLLQRFESTNSTVPILFQLYLNDIFLILLFIIFLIKTFVNKNPSRYLIRQSKLFVPMLLWIGMGILSLIPAIDKIAAGVGVLQMIRIFLTFFIFFHYVKTAQDLHFILTCLLIGILLQSILMIAQYLSSSIIVPENLSGLDIVEQGFRPTGTMGHSSHFAKISGLLLPTALAYIFFASKYRTRLIVLLIWILGSIALILTLSRAGIAAWAFSIIIFILCIIIMRIIPTYKRFQIILSTIILTVFSCSILYWTGGERLENRIREDNESISVRVPMWKVAVNVIVAKPTLGVGLKNYTLVHQNFDKTIENIAFQEAESPVHNLFFLYAAEIGILGLLFFLWFIFELLKNAILCACKIDKLILKVIYVTIFIGVINVLLQSTSGKGVVDNLIHLSVISIFAACIAKQSLMLIKKKHEP